MQENSPVEVEVETGGKQVQAGSTRTTCHPWRLGERPGEDSPSGPRRTHPADIQTTGLRRQ